MGKKVTLMGKKVTLMGKKVTLMGKKSYPCEVDKSFL
jgi:hypothetical protein